MKTNHQSMGRKTYIISVLFLGLLLLSMLQGCLATRKSEAQYGSISGSLSVAKSCNLLAVSEDRQVLIPVDGSGHFSARLEPGVYQLSLQAGDGTLTLFKKAVQIENNMSVTVVDTDMVPIPHVMSVSVPLVYSTSAIIEWETDIESDGYVEFGSNELYGYSSYGVTELKKKHRIQLYNLLPASTYHFRVVASRYSLESAQSISRDFVFTTEP